MFSEADRVLMGRALALARRGLWTTTPNPRVGCVLSAPGAGSGAGFSLISDGADSADRLSGLGGTIIGEGWHQQAGQAHAEVHALSAAGERARGATAYVTLEPCAHHGRTSPCVDALIQAGVARVIVAMEDPNPLVAGRGLARLRAAGIEVRCGLLADEALELNLGFVARMTRGLPWVRLKVAASLDGRTALPDGRSQWITGAAARADGHAWRARACAILTGIGTVRDDDPQLTVRDLPDHLLPASGPIRQPQRVLIDSRLEIDPQARLVRAGDLLLVHALDPAWLVAGPLAEKASLLQDHGVELLSLPQPRSPASEPQATGPLPPPSKVDLGALLAELARREVNELHVEAGAALNGSLLREGWVDELLIYLAPALLGDSRAMFKLVPPESLELAKRFYFHAVEAVGDDLRILARDRQRSTV